MAIGRHRGWVLAWLLWFSLMRHTALQAFNSVRTAGVNRGKIMCSFREEGHLLPVNNIRVCVGIIVMAWRI